MRTRTTVVVPLLVLSAIGSGAAAYAEDGIVLPPIAVHGFVSPGYILTTNGNKYIADSTDGGSVEFSEAGINFTALLTDRLRVGLQLFARDRGPVGNYDAKVDWFYLDYRWRDWFGLRAGRIKIPFGLYNETSDTDAARVPVLLPQSVYPIENRDFLLAQTGGELYGYVSLCDAGALEYRLFGGTVYLELEDNPSAGVSVIDLSIPYLFGGRILWETPLEGLRIGGSLQALRLDTNLRLTQPAATDVYARIDAILWVASLEYALGDAQIAAEYSQWHTDTVADPAIVPPSETVSQRAYVMFAYRVSPRVQLGLYYSLLFPDTDQRSGRENRQHDVAATLRFDIEEHWLVKLEGHYMNGTADLDSGLNDGRERSTLAEQWAVFLLKTTAYF